MVMANGPLKHHPIARRTALGAALLLVVIGACARSRFVARPDVTPRLTETAPSAAAQEAARRDPQAGPALAPDEELEHALSRTSFGMKPGDRARVSGEGISAYLEEQLHPEAIDDAALEQRISGIHALNESTAERMRELVQFREEKRKEKEAEVLQAAPMADASPLEMKAEPMPEAPASAATTPPDLPAYRRDKKTLGKIGRGPGFDFTLALAEAKLLRAIYSKHQLNEVMTDFWFNHFNVFAGKDREAALLPAYEAELRANALGSFRALLLATAHSPAMLIYLDNWRSTSNDAPKPRKGRFATAELAGNAQPKRGRGLNENYGRELLELHTLGVDGGYTQADVTEVARCFTGWSVDDPQRDPKFAFHPRAHDGGEKHVLGETIAAGGGQGDGDRVLELVLKNPSTARFLATKLVRRFVEDEPPPALVEKVAQTYLDTLSSGGDIRSMLRAIFSSPEFWSRRALKAKMRSPLELVAGSARALGANIDDPFQLARQVARIGEPLYAYAPPTGYGDTAATWGASGALLTRIDFGLALAAGQVDGVTIDLGPISQGTHAPGELLDRASKQLGADSLSDSTRSYVLEQLRDLSFEKKPELVAERAVGLLLGAPELQRR
jgi:uncharacterized protein (DUF1800 family)